MAIERKHYHNRLLRENKILPLATFLCSAYKRTFCTLSVSLAESEPVTSEYTSGLVAASPGQINKDKTIPL